jgi:DNA polymerase beta
LGSFRRGQAFSLSVELAIWHPYVCLILPYTRGLIIQLDRSYSVLRDNDEAARALMAKVKAALTAAGLMSPDFLFSNGTHASSFRISQCSLVLSEGIKKTMVLTKLPEKVLPGAGYRLMDVRLCNTTSVPYFLLHNTGDETLMKILRREAFHR